ncbi:hypothetical protein NC652_033470 [Populus alba x Populus x berolinensis]|nr:hypothetical protein NC652_033470 [Populus alba x Populus x berolinensis]
MSLVAIAQSLLLWPLRLISRKHWERCDLRERLKNSMYINQAMVA